MVLTVFSILSQHLAPLVSGVDDAGDHSVQFNAGNLSGFVFFYRLQAEAFTQTRSLLFVR